MKATSVERGALTRRLQHGALAGIIGALALGACGNDGPKYGEIPRDAGRSGSAGKGGMATVPPVGGAGGEHDAGGAGGEDSSGGTHAGSTTGGKGGMGGKGGTGGMGGTSAGGSGGSGGTSTSKCGNSVVDEGETCDDGNKVSGDGCSSECLCACEACEASEGCNARANHNADVEPFLPFYQQGYEMAGLAVEGPAANVPRKDLFRAAVDCVRKTSCLEVLPGGGVVLIRCACLNPHASGEGPTTWPAACFNEALLMPGPCLVQLREAAEADSLLTVKERSGSHEYAIGLAQGLFNNCDVAECRSECFKPEQTATWGATVYDAPVKCGNCEAENACMAP